MWVRWNCIIVATPRKPASVGVMCIYVGIMWVEITPIFGHNAMGVSLTDTQTEISSATYLWRLLTSK